ncbi:MAG TPA: DUF3592 domain-containing protein [Roseomonas sp.]|jgi:hypothetical protein
MKEVAIIFVAMLVLMAGGAAAVWGPGYLRHREATRLRAEGTPATAVIQSLDDTGNRFNDLSEIEVRLQVTAEGRTPWPASIRVIMGVPETLYFTPGRQIPVRFDPAKPDRVAYAP